MKKIGTEKNEKIKYKRVAVLLKTIYESTRSDFYRLHWGEGVSLVLEELPEVIADQFITVPYRQRLYTTKKSVIKVVEAYKAPFMVSWDSENLKKEKFGTSCERPLVLMSESQEAVEKSMWFYENGILPVIGENSNLEVSTHIASRYEIDALITDTRILERFLPLLERKYDVKNIRTLTLIGDYFTPQLVADMWERFQVVRFVLALPEAGAFAESCPEMLAQKKLIFHPNENSILETNGRLVVTRCVLLPTPVIRYRTEIFAKKIIQSACACPKESFEVI